LPPTAGPHVGSLIGCLDAAFKFNPSVLVSNPDFKKSSSCCIHIILF